MPWSDWQDPFDGNQPLMPRKVVITRVDGAIEKPAPGDPGQITELRDGLTNPLANNTNEIVNPFAVGPAYAQQSFVPYETITTAVAAGALAQRVVWYEFSPEEFPRPWLPAALDNLTEGVDYTLRPDRDGSEPDAYVQYEDDQVRVQASDVTEWTNLLSLTVTLAEMDSVTNATSGKARVYKPDTWIPAPPEGEGEYAQNPFTPPYGTGTNLVTVMGDQGASNQASHDLPPGVYRWQAIVEPSFESFELTANAYSAEFNLDVDSRVLLLYPRWRYWVPDTTRLIPLRQRQRDDGLGPSTRRAHGGTSRQRSIRQRGYY